MEWVELWCAVLGAFVLDCVFFSFFDSFFSCVITKIISCSIRLSKLRIRASSISVFHVWVRVWLAWLMYTLRNMGILDSTVHRWCFFAFLQSCVAGYICVVAGLCEYILDKLTTTNMYTRKVG